MNVISYLKGIPASNKNPEKPEVLKRFIQGVNNSKLGDYGTAYEGSNWQPSDVAVLQGYVHEDSPMTPHLRLRKEVLEKQKQNNKRTVIIDSNLFLYRDLGNTKKYLRYSYDGVFPSTAEYCWSNQDPNRWNKISKDLNIKLKDWRSNGNNILICMQRNGGWSMKGNDVWDWLEKTIWKIRQHSDRPIIVRGHPGDRKTKAIIKQKRFPKGLQNLSNVYFSDIERKTLLDDLQNAWATVVFNSSPSVASAIEGVPVFCEDDLDCQASDVANTNLALIETPNTFDRQPWIEKLAMCHWNWEDLSNCTAWKHMREYV